jgi:hypothetical protein
MIVFNFCPIKILGELMSAYSFAPNPFPAKLREELPYPSALWLVSRELFKRLAAAPAVDQLYKKIQLNPDDPEAMFVQKY